LASAILARFALNCQLFARDNYARASAIQRQTLAFTFASIELTRAPVEGIAVGEAGFALLRTFRTQRGIGTACCVRNTQQNWKPF